MMAGILNKRFRFFYILFALVLYILSTPYAPRVLLWPLEGIYLTQKPNLIGINAIVVLGGGLNESALDSKLSEVAFKRFTEGFALAKTLNLPLIYSGGGLERSDAKITETEAAQATALAFGKSFGFSVPIYKKVTNDFGFIGEARSNTTAENAFFTSSIFHDSNIKNPKIALVTSASHMRRASIMFTKYGFQITPIAVDFKVNYASSWMPSFRNLAPTFYDLTNSLSAFYEYLGLAKFYLWSK